MKEKPIVLVTSKDFTISQKNELMLNAADEFLIVFYSKTCPYTKGALDELITLLSDSRVTCRLGQCEITGMENFLSQSSLNLEGTPIFVMFKNGVVTYKNGLPPDFSTKQVIPKVVHGQPRYCTLDSAYGNAK